MAAEIKSDQRITRLTPLAEALTHIDTHVTPAEPQIQDVASACRLTLSENTFTACSLPPHAIALRDGYAVDADAVRDASSFAPVSIPIPPLVPAGAQIPHEADAILSQDAVSIRGTFAEISTPTIVGDGILPEGADATPAAPLLPAGRQLTRTDIAVLRAAGISHAQVRAPRVSVLLTRKSDRILDAAGAWTMQAVAAAGGHASDNQESFESALVDSTTDALIAIGGTGSGPHDRAVMALAKAGKVFFHGIAIAPGETAAFGFVGNKPVLLMPGRLDAVLACWSLLGDRLVARLCNRPPREDGRTFRLTRKAASSLGITEMIPVSCKGEEAEPLATNYLSLQTLARADGWISVPAQSEGYPAGTIVTVRSLP